MTNRKSTKKALLTSCLALLLCFSMLVGTTFAWFTDSVTSGTNQILAGNLDVEVYNSLNVGENKVDGDTKLFNEITYWEPGVVAYENLTVANVGNLALKYQLSVNFTDATATADGRTLADVLKVGFVEGGIKSTTREGALSEVKEWLPLASFAQNGELYAEEGKDTHTYGIVIYWQPSDIDNYYNMNNGQTTVLSINLGIKLVATQLMNENDSFGPDYDADAILPWDGSADTSWYDDDKTEFVLYTAEELAGLSKLVSEGNNFSGKTVKLGADINLGNKAWTPIGRTINTSGTGEDSTFKGNFDGQGNTIYNLNVDTVDAVSDTNKGAGLFGAITGNISNVNVVNATINTNHWAGVIAGSIEGSITNCSVTNATITCLVDTDNDNGDKAGAIAGYATSGTIENCSVTNATITAYRDMGAIVGGSYNSVVKCTVSNVTLIKDNTNDYKGDKDDTTVNAYVGTVYSDATVDATGDVTIHADANTKYIASAAQLVALVEEVNGGNTYEGKTVALIADINLSGIEWTPIDNFKGTFNGNGHTISNLTVVADKYAGMFGYLANSGATITNLTIDGASVTANTVDTDGYAGAVLGYHYSSGARVYVENVTVTNSTITGKNGGGLIGAASGAFVTNCTSTNNTITASRNGGIIGKTLEFGSVTGSDVSGNTQNIQIFSDESYVWVGTVVGQVAGGTVDGNETEKRTIASASTQTELESALTDGATILNLGEGTYTVPSAAKGKTLTISGTKATKIDVTSGLTYVNASNITFEGVTIHSDPEGAGYTNGLADGKYAIFNNCVIEGTLGLDYSCEFNNCTFNIAGDYYSVWTWGAGTVSFTGCTFNCDGKALLVYPNVLDNGTSHHTVNITDCVFNDKGDDTITGKAAIEITDTYPANNLTFEVNIKNVTVNGFSTTVQNATTYGGTNLGTNVWGNKNLLTADDLDVVINGVEVY